MSYNPRIDKLERGSANLDARVSALESHLGSIPIGDATFEYDSDNSEFILSNGITFSDLAQYYENGGLIYLSSGYDDDGNILIGNGIMIPLLGEDDSVEEFDGFAVNPTGPYFYAVSITADAVSLSIYQS